MNPIDQTVTAEQTAPDRVASEEAVNRFVGLVGRNRCLTEVTVYAGISLLRAGIPLEEALGRTVAALVDELVSTRFILLTC